MKRVGKPFAFVVMPFSSEFDDVYKLGIKEVCAELDVHAERLDEQIFQENMLDRIYKEISRADLLIADMSQKNPNVYFEVGYAYGINQNVLHLTNDSDQIPFDLKHYPYIVYENISHLRDELKPRLEYFLDEKSNQDLYQAENIDVIINGFKLEKDITEITLEKNSNVEFDFNIDLHNSITGRISSEELKVGIITKEYKSSDFGTRDLLTIQLPDGKQLFTNEDYFTIKPGDWKRLSLHFWCSNEVFEKMKKDGFTVRIFHNSGYKDYPVIFNQ